jgi:hypothetical protein
LGDRRLAGGGRHSRFRCLPRRMERHSIGHEIKAGRSSPAQDAARRRSRIVEIGDTACGRKSRCSYLRPKLPSGIPTQVVVPSVSLAALLQGPAPKFLWRRRRRQPCLSQCLTRKSVDLRPLVRCRPLMALRAEVRQRREGTRCQSLRSSAAKRRPKQEYKRRRNGKAKHSHWSLLNKGNPAPEGNNVNPLSFARGFPGELPRHGYCVNSTQAAPRKRW